VLTGPPVGVRCGERAYRVTASTWRRSFGQLPKLYWRAITSCASASVTGRQRLDIGIGKAWMELADQLKCRALASEQPPPQDFRLVSQMLKVRLTAPL
jgi:hypothetical protein